MKWTSSCRVVAALALAVCGTGVRPAEATEPKPDKFEFRFEGWRYSRASGRRLTELKVGGLTVSLRGKAGEGDATTSVRASIVVNPRFSYMSLSFSHAGIDCKGMPGDDHGLEIELESENPVRGTVSGEMRCVEKATKTRTWVPISGSFDAEGL
jgi:hypothetical protein